jgi:hypothetical protein
MPEFLLVLHEKPSDYARYSPEEMQKIVQEYGAWAMKLGRQGKLEGGKKLTESGGRVLKLKGGKATVTDGPYAEAKEVFAGFFIVKARDYDEAVELARTCPHVKYGTRIEVREVDRVRRK